MLATITEEFRGLELRHTRAAAPPRVLQEKMPIEEGDTTTVPLLDHMLTIWSGWREEDAQTPEWSRFRPFEHPRVLPHISLYEHIGERFRCSIVGEEAGRFMPVKMAGNFLDEAMPAENIADVSKRLAHASKTGKPNFVEKTMAWKSGHDLRTYRTLQLPFRGGEKQPTRVLCVMNFYSQRL